MRQTVAAFGGIDILVWNSGGPPPGPAIGITAESLEEAVSCSSSRRSGSSTLLPYLVQSPAGRILVFTSVAARTDRPSRAEQRRAARRSRLGEDALP